VNITDVVGIYELAETNQYFS